MRSDIDKTLKVNEGDSIHIHSWNKHEIIFSLWRVGGHAQTNLNPTEIRLLIEALQACLEA